MSQTERVNYGDHPSQHVDIWRSGSAAPALIFVIHGGFWREALSADLTLRIAESLSETGFRVANIEYRGVGGAGGWPATFQDVRAAIESVRRRFPEPITSFVVGHSAGGCLALLALAAGLAEFAVALAPVSDIERALGENLGDGAAADFLGALKFRLTSSQLPHPLPTWSSPQSRCYTRCARCACAHRPFTALCGPGEDARYPQSTTLSSQV